MDPGYHGPRFRWDPHRRDLIRAELDATMFRLYGIDRDDVDYIMDTFLIVRRRDAESFGEYRTKRLILRALRRALLLPTPAARPTRPLSIHLPAILARRTALRNQPPSRERTSAIPGGECATFSRTRRNVVA